MNYPAAYLAAAILFWAGLTAPAATLTWINTSGGNWSAAANWQPQQVPVAGDSVLLTTPGSYTVTLDVDATVASLTLGAGTGSQILSNATRTLNVTSNGSVTGGGSLKLSGGSLRGVVNIQAGGTLNFATDADKVLYSCTLINSGTVQWTGGRLLGGSTPTTLITNLGLWDIQADSPLTYGGGPEPLFVNLGTFRKSGGPGTTTINNWTFDNRGLIEVQTGALIFSNGTGSPLGGTFDVAAGTTLTLNSGSYVDAGGVFNGPGVRRMTGGTLTLRTNILAGLTLAGGTVNLGSGFQQGGAITSLTLDGAVLSGSNQVAGLVTVNAGALTGQLRVQTGGMLVLATDADKVLYSCTLINSGTVQWTGGRLLGGSTPTTLITNLGLWDIQADSPLTYGGGPEPLFVNLGTFRKSGGPGTTTVNNWTFDNRGLIEVQTGALIFSNGTGSPLGGTFDVAAGTTLTLNSGSYVDAGGVFNGPGVRRMTGGTLTLRTNILAGLTLAGGTVNLGSGFQQGGAITSLTLDGAVLSGSNQVAGLLTVNAGALTGQLRVQAGGMLVLATDADKVLYSCTLISSGTVQWTGGRLLGGSTPSTLITNLGLWDIQADSPLTYGGGPEPLFVNLGTFRKSGGPGTTTVNNWTFDNRGLIEVQTGALIFSNGTGSPLGGTFDVAAGTTLTLNSGSYVDAGGVFNGPGVRRMTGGTLTLRTNILAGLTLAGGTVNLGSGFQQGGAITSLTLDGAVLSGSNQVAGLLTVNAGALTGQLRVQAGGMLVLATDADKVLYSCTLISSGTVQWTGGRLLGGSTPSTLITNLGLWDIQADSPLTYGGGPEPLFVNLGTFRKSGGPGTTTVNNWTFDNRGLIEVQTGALIFSNGTGSPLGGTFDVSAGTTLTLNSGSYVDAGGVFNGPGVRRMTGGTLTLRTNILAGLTLAGGTVNLGSGFQQGGAITSLTLDGAVLSGSNQVAGLLTVNAGALTGQLRVQAGGMLVLATDADKVLYSCTLISSGTVQWTGGRLLGGSTPSTLITNLGLWDIQADSPLTYGGGPEPLFVNLGTFRKSGGPGTTTVNNWTFDNRGLIEVQTGALIFSNGTGSPLGGTFDVAAGTTLTLNSGSYVDAGGVFNGPGVRRMTGGTLTLRTNILAGLTLAGGTVNLGSGFQQGGAITSLTLDGAFLSGSNQVAGLLTVNAGALTGQLRVQAGGMLVLATDADKVLYSCTLINSGTVQWTGGRLLGGSTPSTLITNLGLWDIQADSPLTYGGGPEPLFVNLGTFRKSGGPGTTTVNNWTFDNRGLVEANLGTLRVPNGFSNFIGIIRLGGGTFEAPSAWTFAGGSLEGNGTVARSTFNGGTIGPGVNGPGKITFPTGLSLSNTVTVIFSANGITPGTGYDQLSVIGSVVLSNATLVISSTTQIPIGASLILIDNDGSDAVQGTFNGLPEDSLLSSSGQSFRIHYSGGTGNDVTLVSEGGSGGGCVLLPSGLIAWWPGEGNAIDFIGGNHAQLNNGVAFGPGKLGPGFVLDGVDDYLSIADNPRFTLEGALSVDAWIRPTTVSGDRAIISQYDTASSQASWAFLVLDGGRLRLTVFQDGGVQPRVRAIDSVNPVITAGVFSHVAGTFNPVTQVLKLFVNGQEVPASLAAGSTTVSALFDSQTPIRIGALVDIQGQLVDFFSGQIDEVELFRRELSVLEVAALFNAGTSGRCTDSPYLAFPDSFPTLQVGIPYVQLFQAALGLPPYTFSIVAGTVPTGMTLAANGGLSGTPTTPGIFDFTIGIADSRGAQSTHALRVQTAASVPVIVSQPIAKTIPEGGSAVFSVEAQGTGPLNYQWRFEGANIPSATTADLSVATAGLPQAGRYTVVVSNPSGSVTSQEALLTVLIAPNITSQPQSQSVLPGAVALTVGVSGTGPFFYQWRRNGQNIPGATSGALTINSFQATDAGNFSVIVATAQGAAISQGAQVTAILPALPFADNFANRTAVRTATGLGRGSNVGASREAGEPDHAGKNGGSSLWLTWIAPGNGLATFNTRGSGTDTLLAVYSGASFASLTEVASDDDSGGYFASAVAFNALAGEAYQIAVDALGGSEGEIVLAWNLAIGADPVAVILQEPISLTVAQGANASFTVIASNPPPAAVTLTYRWFFNDAPIPGAASDTLTIPNASVANLGAYFVEVSKGLAPITSQSAFLQINTDETGTVAADVSSEDKFIDLAQPIAGLAQASLQRAGLPGGGRPAGGLASGYTGTQVFSTYGSTTEAGEPELCGVIGGASQWYSYRAEASGELTITTDGSDFDTVLAVYTGTGDNFDSLQPITCDNNGGADGRDSLVRFTAVANNVYFVAVDGVNGVTGNVQLSYDLAVPLRLSGVGVEAGQFRLRLIGRPGVNYTLEGSVDLLNWTPLVSTNSSSATFDLRDPSAGNVPIRFYRGFQSP